MSITIPRTIAGAERKLAELAELATATEWERAAIVAAFVKVGHGHGGRRETPDTGSFESAVAFARRGIHGLTSGTTVSIYASAWLDITDEDGNVIGHRDRPRPGGRVELPDDPWPPTRTGTDGYSSDDGATATIERMVKRHGAARIAQALPVEVERAAAANALSEPTRRHRTLRDVRDRHPEVLPDLIADARDEHLGADEVDVADRRAGRAAHRDRIDRLERTQAQLDFLQRLGGTIRSLRTCHELLDQLDGDIPEFLSGVEDEVDRMLGLANHLNDRVHRRVNVPDHVPDNL